MIKKDIVELLKKRGIYKDISESTLNKKTKKDLENLLNQNEPLDFGQLTTETATISGSTYSQAHYDEYSRTGNKNIFEEVIDKMMLDYLPQSIVDKIVNLPLEKKRMTILAFLDNDKNLFKKIKSLVGTDVSKLEHIKDVVSMLRTYVKVGEVEKKTFGEVMTPLELVKEMLATLPTDVWSNPDLKWLDSCNGAGAFLSMVVWRLMEGLKEWEPDHDKRYKHIVENMVYAGELQPKNMFLWMCLADPLDEFKLNVYTGSFLESGFDKHMKDVWGLEKFDIVVGNPPYQEMDGGNGASAKPLYNVFIEKCIKISNVILYITPSRWFAGGKGLDSFRKMMMKSNKIKLIKHFDNEVFAGVNIAGGVSYFLFNNNYNGICSLNGNVVILSEMDIIVKDTNSHELINKFINKKDISTISNPRSYFGIPTNFKDISDIKLSDDYIKCYFSQNKGFSKWVHKKHTKNTDSYYRVATPRANGNSPKFGNLFIVEPFACVSDSYISFFVKTKEEVNSLLSYLKTKFANYLLSKRKISQTIKPDTCKWIPIVSFDREWTDDQLFDYFNLSEEERNIILNYDNNRK